MNNQEIIKCPKCGNESECDSDDLGTYFDCCRKPHQLPEDFNEKMKPIIEKIQRSLANAIRNS